jgi:hypothetical protein
VIAHTLLQSLTVIAWSVAPTGACGSPRDSKLREVVLESARTQEIRMIWLLTGLLSVALIFTSLRIGAYLLLKYDTGNRD